jgi:diguanylate cyclase (GGDEF)-like protein
VHKLFAKQLAKAQSPAGIDIDLLTRFVSTTYEEADKDRRRTDRSIGLMIEELDHLNKDLEKLVADRTAALCEREQELRAQNVRFDAALNNMSQALLLFDASARLIICNRRYQEMYGLSPNLIQPGCTLRELLKRRCESGTMSGDPETYISDLSRMLARGHVFERIFELPDGRTICVMSHPMVDGGWLATHEDITARQLADRQIAHMARHDALTDLPNRVLLREQLAMAVERTAQGEGVAVLYLDLDQFKTINDSLGHPIGDKLLKAVAGRLRHCVRDGDTVSRVGGDEFAIVQNRIQCANDVAMLAQRICEGIRAPYDVDGHQVVVGTSVGIALAPADGTEPEGLLRKADMALYRAKSDGRGGYSFFEPQMEARAHTRRQLELALRSALQKGEFELYYQPVLDLESNEIKACEALIRWHHPEQGLVWPSEFIAVAEEIGLIAQIGEWVIRQACEDAAKWPNHIKVAVNLSPAQVTSSSLVSVVVNALAQSCLSPQRLELEITEAVLLRNTEAVHEALQRLRALGVGITMDDFGTGYSSFGYVRSFRFDKIKIDRSFVGSLPEEGANAIVQAMSILGRTLNMATTAEGVETEQQFNRIRALGCTQMQGYFFCPPKRFDEISSLLARTAATRASGAA